jgi:ankyrin repeat protein
MRATKTNDLPVMRLLLEGGADPALTLKDRTTTAMMANSLEAVKLLVERGVDVNAFNTNGQTIVHNAAGRGANAIIQFAVEKGARLDKKDKQGRTPLDIANGAGGGGRGGRGGGNPATADLIRRLITANGK